MKNRVVPDLSITNLAGARTMSDLETQIQSKPDLGRTCLRVTEQYSW